VSATADVREQLLRAALQVYARAGTRGATTRRIAEEAGVNEVTLFRHFGSKDALIAEALTWGATQGLWKSLPDDPADPARELLEFSRLHHQGLTEARALIRTCMSEFAEQPAATHVACDGPARIAADLERYLERLRATGLATGTWDPRSAAAMLMGTLFADAMGREFMPEHYTQSEADAIQQYVSLFVRAIGCPTDAAASADVA